MDQYEPPEKAPALDYAPVGAPREGGAWWRVLIVLAVVVVLWGLMEWGLDAGQRIGTCRLCGARCDDRYIYFFGVGGAYGRRIHAGALPKLIEEVQGKPCRPHTWRMRTKSGGGLLTGWRAFGCYRGDYSFISSVELALKDNEHVRQRLKEDAELYDRLRAVRMNRRSPATNELITELFSLAFLDPQPATQPETSGPEDSP